MVLISFHGVWTDLVSPWEGGRPDRKICRCLRNTRPSRPYEVKWFGAMDATKPYSMLRNNASGPDMGLPG